MPKNSIVSGGVEAIKKHERFLFNFFLLFIKNQFYNFGSYRITHQSIAETFKNQIPSKVNKNKGGY